MRILIIFFTCVLIITQNACVLWQYDSYWENTTMETIHIDVLEPANTNIPYTIRNILIVPPHTDSIHYSILATKHDGSDVVSLKQYIQNIIEGSYNSLTSLISESPRFDNILLFNQEIDSLYEGDVITLCDSNHADAILYLSGMRTSFSLSPLRLYDSYDNGASEYFFEIDICIRTQWTLYRPYDSLITIPITSTVKLTRFTNASTYEEIYESNDMQNIIDQIKYMPGEACAGKIAPLWKQSTRYLFSRGNTDLRKAYKYYETGNIDTAMMIWKKNQDHKEPIVAKHAQYNMIFGYEMRGELDSALVQATMFCRQYNLEAAINYKSILENRIKSDRQVRDQLQE